jgi:hypothetical protein
MVIITLLFLTIIFYIVYVVLVLAHTKVAADWQWLYVVPWESLASGCLGSLVVAFAYEWFIRKETDDKLEQMLEQHFQRHQQALNGEIVRIMLTHREIMKDILSPDVVDRVIRAALEIHLGDLQLAKEVYDTQLSHLLTQEERRSNYRCNIYMAPLKDANLTDDARLKYYETCIDVRYDTYLLRDSFRFTCVSSTEDYDALLRSLDQEVWVTEPSSDFPKLDASVFDIEKMTVSTHERSISLSIQRETLGKQFVITASDPQLATMIGKQVKVYYRYRVKPKKRGHLLMISVPCPTHNVMIAFDYAHTDIRFVNVLDFFGGKITPKILYTPSEKEPHRVEIEVNGWVFPMGGVALVWVLDAEMTQNFIKLMADS